MKAGVVCLWALSCCALASVASAQSRDTGWEFGADVTYQTSKDVDLDTTDVAFDDDIGLTLFGGYRAIESASLCEADWFLRGRGN